MGTEIIMIILLWCGDITSAPNTDYQKRVHECRREKIECVRTLPKGFDNDDIVDKCLMGKR